MCAYTSEECGANRSTVVLLSPRNLRMTRKNFPTSNSVIYGEMSLQRNDPASKAIMMAAMRSRRLRQQQVHLPPRPRSTGFKVTVLRVTYSGCRPCSLDAPCTLESVHPLEALSLLLSGIPGRTTGAEHKSLLVSLGHDFLSKIHRSCMHFVLALTGS